ncbi:MAG TPA: isoprenylcysteine carboxylmethyltransferase family protein [Pararobbsia sp.]|nr:isoprenylcysteine carboxylmethyltransferase family protein [Pararobbsia sp.]
MLDTSLVTPVTPVQSPQNAGTAPSSAQRTWTPSSLLFEAAVRTCSTLLLAVFVYAAWIRWRADPERITLLLLVVAACLTVGLSIFARTPRKRDWRSVALVCSVGGTYYFLAVRLAPGVSLIPELAGAALQMIGLFCQVFAKLSLRRSFGILPANRGVVSSGAYRFVRHPMYFGYFLTDMGFLLSNFGLQNVLVYSVQFALQAGRIVREEKLLSEDAQYVRYKSSVRYRVIPGVF